MTRRSFPIRMVAALAWVFAATVVAVHPQDGPHADVRITVREDAVVFNIAMNLVFVDEVVSVPREQTESLHPVEGEPVRDALLAYYQQANTVKIDGIKVEPRVRDFEVIQPDHSLLPLFPVSGLRGLQRVRIVLDYPAKSEPKQVAMTWGPFPEDALLSTPEMPRRLEIAAEMKALGLDSIITFTETEPEYIWHNTGTTPEERFLPVPQPQTRRMLSVPVPSMIAVALAVVAGLAGLVSPRRRRAVRTLTPMVLLLALAVVTWPLGRADVPNPLDSAASLPTSDEALSVFGPLHANIYRAFDYSAESDVYDALARSVDGRLLDELYNEIYRSLIMYEEGGAVSRVQAVIPLDSAVTSIGQIAAFDTVGFTVDARWQVKGVVYHWGHAHRRTNEYVATYSVISTDEGWRIAASQVTEQFRVDAEPGAPPFVLPPGAEL